MIIEQKLDELISLVRALDTKIGFIEDDLNYFRESIDQIKFIVEGLEEGTQPVNEPKYKVETF